ncbi:hypothetical protein D3C80_1624660 [compost metagenome]
MKPVAKSTERRASLALGTVKKRIRICGRPAMPNTRPRDSDTALIGSASMEPGPMMPWPMAWASIARPARFSKLKPNSLMAISTRLVPPASRRTALTICTQVVAIMPPKIT